MAEPQRLRAQLIDEALIDATLVRARSSVRLRATHNLHGSHEDPFHRFLNALIRGTYVAPHRHIAVPKPETFVVLRGKIGCFVFDDDGRVTQQGVLGEGGLYGMDVEAGTWHTVLPVSPEAVVIEMKLGPWDPKTDKEFAPWAPLEGDPRAAAYAEHLLTALRQV